MADLFEGDGIVETEFKATVGEYLEFRPCESGRVLALSRLGPDYNNSQHLSILNIWETNGYMDAVWALRAIDGHESEIRLFNCACARLVLPIWEKVFPSKTEPRNAIEASEKYAYGEIDIQELLDMGTVAKQAAWAVPSSSPQTAGLAASITARAGTGRWSRCLVVAVNHANMLGFSRPSFNFDLEDYLEALLNGQFAIAIEGGGRYEG